jgi:hypothetical protein
MPQDIGVNQKPILMGIGSASDRKVVCGNGSALLGEKILKIVIWQEPMIAGFCRKNVRRRF